MLLFSLFFFVIAAIALLKSLTLRDPLWMLITVLIVVIGGAASFDFAPWPLKSLMLVGLMILSGGLL
jgi:hypothetical protein